MVHLTLPATASKPSCSTLMTRPPLPCSPRRWRQFQVSATDCHSTSAVSGGVIDGRLRVILPGSAVLLDRTLEFGAPGNGPFYIPQRIRFVANSATTTLRFEDRSISPRLADSCWTTFAVTTENAEAPLITCQPQRTAVAIGR